jgi:hypothetical protein
LRDYGRNPYVGYDMAAAPFLYRGDFPKSIEAMARVVVVRAARQDRRRNARAPAEQGRLIIGNVELMAARQSTALIGH